MKVLVGFSQEEYPNVETFRSIGDCTFIRYDRAYLLDHIAEYDFFVPNLFDEVDTSIISKDSKLKVLATPSTGKDHLDVEAILAAGIHFISLNDDRAFIDEISSTAEMSWMLTLACMRNIRGLFDRVQVDKNWVNTDIRGYELKGKVLGIIGYGRLGKMVARYGQAFGMRVHAYDIDESQYDDVVKSVDFNTLCSESDVISLHAKLNPGSENIIDEKAVGLMKEGVVIVNTARGGMIDSNAIMQGLDANKIRAVGLDVCNDEYEAAELPRDPLVERSFVDKRIIVTPHAGGSTLDAHGKVFGKVAELIKKYMNEKAVDTQ